MNKKGVLFSTDLIIALTLVVFLLGSMYVFYSNNLNNVIENKKYNELESNMNIVLNNIALGSASCILVDDKDKEIKKVSFCLDTRKSFDLDLNFRIEYENGYFGKELSSEEYIAKDLNVWISDKNITKEEYFNCVSNTCNLTKEVRVYVWK